MARPGVARSFHGFGGRRAGWRLTTLRYHPGFPAGTAVGVVVGFFLAAYLLTFALADVDGRLASRINREVNSATHGPLDNCVDFSNAKLAALIAAGVDPRDVRTEVVRVRVGPVRRFHQVVVARVDGREVVLDNRTPTIWPLTTYLHANRPLPRR